jgi:hypothetical protein
VIIGAFVVYSLTRGDLPEEPVRIDELNTKVYIARRSGCIAGAVVDITPQRALVCYDRPDGMDETTAWINAMTMLSVITPDVEKAVVEVYKDFAAQTRVTANMADLLELADGLIDAE